MSVLDNIVIRLVGLFIFFAPNNGIELLAEIHVRVNQNIRERA